MTGLSSYLSIEVNGLSSFLYSHFKDLRRNLFFFILFIIFFAGNLLIAIYLECNYEFSVIKYQDLLQKGLWNKPCNF